MGTRSPEGGSPFNIDPKTVRVAPEQRQYGSGFKKPEEPKQQPSDPDLEAIKRMLKKPKRPIVAGGEAHMRNQRRLVQKRDNGTEARG
jgi:hypothetical protein